MFLSRFNRQYQQRYNQLQERKNNITNNYIHKLIKFLIEECIKKVLFNFEYNIKKINIKYELMELNLSRKVKLNNFYENNLIKKQKLKIINYERCLIK